MDESTNNTQYDESSGFHHTHQHTASPRKQSSGDSWFGLVLIALGAIFLLNTFDIIPWEVWTQVWRFWPLLLVFWGLQTLLGKSTIAHGVMVLFVAIVLFFVGLYVLSEFHEGVRRWSEQNFDWLPQVELFRMP